MNKWELVALKSLQSKQKVAENAIQQTLKKSLVAMHKEMKTIYEKYASGGILTKVEMTKYQRFSEMEKQMMSKLSPAIKFTIDEIKRLTPEQYSSAFFQSAWAIDQQSGVALSWGTSNPNNLIEAYDIMNKNNELLIKALHNYDDEAKARMTNTLLKGLAQGKTLEKMSKDLELLLNKTANQALRIARTESLRAINKGTTDSYLIAKENGIVGYTIWVATLDMRTRPNHAAMDGLAKQYDGLFHGSLITPYPGWEGLPADESINCRCTMYFQITDYAPALRRSRDQGLMPKKNYNEWLTGIKNNGGKGLSPEMDKAIGKKMDALTTSLAKGDKAYSDYYNNPAGKFIQTSITPTPKIPKEKKTIIHSAKFMEKQATKNAPPPVVELKPGVPVTKGIVSFTSDLKYIKKMGGSTGAWMGEDAKGIKYIVKEYGNAANPETSIYNELLASKFYKELGIDVPDMEAGMVNGKLALISKKVDGIEVSSTHSGVEGEIKKEIQKGFISDAFIANWDSVGMSADNILVNKAGKVITATRIDLGGSFGISAQGTAAGNAKKYKIFSQGEVSELKTLLDSSINPSAAKWFSEVDDKIVVAQIKDLTSKITPEKIRLLVGESGLIQAEKDELIYILEKRLAYLKGYAEDKTKELAKLAKLGKAKNTGEYFNPVVVKATGRNAGTALGSQEIQDALDEMPLPGLNALDSFTGGGFKKINNNVLNDINSNTVKALQKAIPKLPQYDDILVRGIYNMDSGKLNKFISGEWTEMKWKAFSSTQYGLTGIGNKPIQFLILNNGHNVNGGLIGIKSSTSYEKEYLINAGQRFKVVGLWEKKGDALKYSTDAKKVFVLEPIPANAPPTPDFAPGTHAPKTLTNAQVESLWDNGTDHWSNIQ